MICRTLVAICLSLSLTHLARAQHWLGAPQQVAGDIGFVADFDGDGDADLLRNNTALALQGTVNVVLNDGQGRFVDGPLTALIGAPGRPDAVADFTGDGVLDLAVRQVSSSSPFGAGIWIHPGLGGGNFGVPVFIALEGNVFSMATGDLNGDGREDLAVLSYDTALGLKRLRWFVGAPGNVFTPTPGLLIPFLDPGPYEIEVLDVDGDLVPDIVGSGTPSTLLFYPTVAGDVTDGPDLAMPLGSDPRMSLADLNGDGLTDVFTHQSVVGGILTAVALNSGGGVFTAGPAVMFPEVALGPIFHADWDNDGDQDALVRGSPDFGGDYSLLLNDGSGGFTLGFNRPLVGVANGGAGFADLDADGFIDFVGANEIWFGDGKTSDPLLPIENDVSRIVDFDGDGDLDLVAGQGALRINNGRGEFTLDQRAYPQPPEPFFYDGDVMVADFDSDGVQDYLVAYLESPGPFMTPIFIEMRVLRGTVQGAFVDAGAAAPAGARMDIADGRTTPFVDLDGDGLPDVVAADGVWRGTVPGQFSLPVDAYPGWRPVDAADLDADGDVDLLAYSSGTPFQVAVLRHDGALGFTAEILATSGFSSEPQDNRTRLLDLDDDGDLDVIYDSGTSGATTVEIAENLGALFAAPVSLPLPTLGDTAIDGGDIDGDGLTDLVIGSASSFGASYLVLRRTGPGLVYESPRSYLGGGLLELHDIDHDGDTDVVGRAVTFNRRHFGLAGGNVRQYGEGSVGSGGLRPLLSTTGPVRVGDLTVSKLRHALGGSTAILLAGPAESNVQNSPFPGNTLLVSPVTEFFYLGLSGTFGAAGEGGIDLPYYVPPFFAGVSLYLQFAVLDFGGASPLTMSNGVEVNFGL